VASAAEDQNVMSVPLEDACGHASVSRLLGTIIILVAGLDAVKATRNKTPGGENVATVRDEFPQAVLEAIARQVGHRCSNPCCCKLDCGRSRLLTGDSCCAQRHSQGLRR